MESQCFAAFTIILRSGDCCFAEALKELCFYGYRDVEMKSHHNAMLLFQIVPMLPNLCELAFRIAIDITGLKDLFNEIRSDMSCIISKYLRHLVMGSYSEPEQQFLLTLLETFYAIDSVSIHRDFDQVTCLDKDDSDLKYALSTNMAGRRILEGRDIGGDEDCDSSIPLSVWPVVLERVQWKINKEVCEDTMLCRRRYKATGLYYLLREGPALMGRRDLVEQPSNKDECPPQQPKRQLCR